MPVATGTSAWYTISRPSTCGSRRSGELAGETEGSQLRGLAVDATEMVVMPSRPVSIRSQVPNPPTRELVGLFDASTK